MIKKCLLYKSTLQILLYYMLKPKKQEDCMSKEVKNIAENTHFKAVCVGPWAEIAQYAAGEVKGKVFLKDALGTTGSEVSVGSLPANTALPFSHAHKQNEEVYIVLQGSGKMQVDDDVFDLQEGTVVRVSPQGSRGIISGPQGITYLCMQTKAGSLEEWTGNDAVFTKTPAKW